MYNLRDGAGLISLLDHRRPSKLVMGPTLRLQSKTPETLHLRSLGTTRLIEAAAKSVEYSSSTPPSIQSRSPARSEVGSCP